MLMHVDVTERTIAEAALSDLTEAQVCRCGGAHVGGGANFSPAVIVHVHFHLSLAFYMLT